jgi:hypothetical protein
MMMTPYARTAAADWMNVTASEYLDRYYPTWRQGYNNFLNSRPADWMNWVYPPYAAGAMAHGTRRAPDIDCEEGWRGRPHPWNCRCRECIDRQCRPCCDPEPCECQCCVGDVDLVVYARVGEQRVIPVVVENPRRREKSITVELSGWRTRGGGATHVETISVEPKTFTLPGCGEHKVSIIARVDAQRESPDVDNCVVAIADLTLVGCDHRPFRVAIAILPRDCSPLRIPCACGCC